MREAEGARRDQDDSLAGRHEALVRVVPRGLCQAAVVDLCRNAGEPAQGAQLLDVLHGRAVDDSGPAQASHQLDELAPLHVL